MECGIISTCGGGSEHFCPVCGGRFLETFHLIHHLNKIHSIKAEVIESFLPPLQSTNPNFDPTSTSDQCITKCPELKENLSEKKSKKRTSDKTNVSSLEVKAKTIKLTSSDSYRAQLPSSLETCIDQESFTETKAVKEEKEPSEIMNFKSTNLVDLNDTKCTEQPLPASSDSVAMAIST